MMMLCHFQDSLVFTEIDATEYLDDLWGRDGPHMHIHITKFEEVLVSQLVNICTPYVYVYMHFQCNFACERISKHTTHTQTAAKWQPWIAFSLSTYVPAL